MTTQTWRWWLLACTLIVAVWLRWPVTPSSESASATLPVLRVLVASELKDMEKPLQDAALQAGLRVELRYAGTLEMVERVLANEPVDALLPASSAYPQLALGPRVLASNKLFYSRLALGLSRDKAQALGWDRQAPTWLQIATAVGAGHLQYALSSPVASNSGMSALFAVAAAAAGKGEDLQANEVSVSVLRDFLRGQKLTAGSSGWLAEAYLRDQAHLDGLINYEAVLLRLNQRPQLRQPLTLIYPRDGVISADYPLLLLREDSRSLYQRWLQVLKSPRFQSEVVRPAFLRPSHADVSVRAELQVPPVAELGFPRQLSVITAVLQAFQDTLRRPATSIYVLDTSGSMAGERMQALRDAMLRLTQPDSRSLLSRLLAFQPRERIVLLPFASTVAPAQVITLGDRQQLPQQLQQISAQVAALTTAGGTAIYAALQQAQSLAQAEQQQRPEALVSIVLLTDGENNEAPNHADWLSLQQVQQAAGQRPVPVFPILFGEASNDAMQQVADVTGGRTFDGRSTALNRVFREIRGYQ